MGRAGVSRGECERDARDMSLFAHDALRDSRRGGAAAPVAGTRIERTSLYLLHRTRHLHLLPLLASHFDFD